MPELVIYGASDDLVEVSGVVDDEFNADLVRLLVVCPDGRQAKVGFAYGDDGCWGVSYAPVDEGVEAPDGKVSCDGYTAALKLDVPEGTTVNRLA